MCQSAGCSAMPRGEVVRDRLGHQPHPIVRAAPPCGPRQLQRPVHVPDRQRPPRTTRRRRTAAPRCAGRAAPGRPASGYARRRSPPRRPRPTGPGRRAAAPRTPGAAAPRGARRTRPVAPGRRDDLHAQPLAEGQEPLVERSPACSRSATVTIGQPIARDPGPGGVPVAGVRQRHDRAPPGGDVLAEQVPALQPEAGAGSARATATAAGTPPASTAGTSASPSRTSSSSSASVQLRADHPAQVARPAA